MALGDVIAKLAVSLNLDASSFERGSKKAAAEAETLGKRMSKVAGIIGTAFVASLGVDTVRAWADATKGALEYAGSLGETAQQIGATTDELQEYRYVASQVGIEQDAMDKGLAKLSVTLGNLGAGVGSTADKLKKFGLSQAEIARLSTMTAGEALPLLAERFKDLVSPTEKAAFAAALWGSKMGGQFIPLLNEGAAGLDKMRDAAHKLGIVISEEAINSSDANSDLLAQLEKINEAQKNATLVLPENVKAFMAYEKAILDVQLAMYKAVGGLAAWAAENKHWETDVLPALQNSGVLDFFKEFDRQSRVFGKTTHDFIVAIPREIGEMVSSIAQSIGGTLRAVWDGAIDKIGAVGAKFRWLYDVVVGHSYVPDMVDGIAAEMARLDAVMVRPVTRAMTASEEAVRDKAASMRGLLARLFPEIQRMIDYSTELASLREGLSERDPSTAAETRLRFELAGVGPGEKTGPDFGDAGPIASDMTKTADILKSVVPATNAWAETLGKLQLVFGQIGGSIGNLAQQIVGSIAGVINPAVDSSIAKFAQLQTAMQGMTTLLQEVFGKKWGGIIGGVLQVASAFAGSFGGGGGFRGFATGTLSAPSGLAMVGERGPELVNFRGGERVYNNRETRGMMGVAGGITVHVHAQDAVLTSAVRGWVAEGVAIAIEGGAAKAQTQAAYRRSRTFR